MRRKRTQHTLWPESKKGLVEKLRIQMVERFLHKLPLDEVLLELCLRWLSGSEQASDHLKVLQDLNLFSPDKETNHVKWLEELYEEPSQEKFITTLKEAGLAQLKTCKTTLTPAEKRFQEQFQKFYDLSEQDLRTSNHPAPRCEYQANQ